MRTSGLDNLINESNFFNRMRKGLRKIGLIASIAATIAISSCLGLTGCGRSQGIEQKVTEPVTPKGNRLLGICISPSEKIDEADAFSLARSRAGIDAVTLHYSWPEIETSPGKFNYQLLDKTNSIYRDVKIIFGINLIETYIKTVPSDLENIPFDDPVMIARFKKLLDKVFPRLPDLQIMAFVFGNEVTGYLVESGEWDAYTTFYEAVSTYVKTIHPRIKVGVIGMLDGYMQPTDKVKTLNRSSDVIALTCYLQPGDVKNDFAALTSAYPGRKIYIQEIGYSSSSVLGSSEEKQKDFVKEVFRAWDEHASQIEYLSFYALHDHAREEVEAVLELMGKKDDPDAKINIEIITTLGLRTYPGKGRDKLAFRTLIQEARARGW